MTVGVPGSDEALSADSRICRRRRNWTTSDGKGRPRERRTRSSACISRKPTTARAGCAILDYCDGMITNWTTHWNDGAMFCTGLERTGPVEIEGAGPYPPPDSFWNVLLTFQVKMRFANGIRWTYGTGPGAFFKIEGSEGWIYADYGVLKAEPASILTSKLGPDAIRFYVKTDKQDFIDCVKTREETLEPAEVGHRVTSLGHLGHIAIQLGQKLSWDPDKEHFVGNDAANAMLNSPIHSPRHA